MVGKTCSMSKSSTCQHLDNCKLGFRVLLTLWFSNLYSHTMIKCFKVDQSRYVYEQNSGCLEHGKCHNGHVWVEIRMFFLKKLNARFNPLNSSLFGMRSQIRRPLKCRCLINISLSNKAHIPQWGEFGHKPWPTFFWGVAKYKRKNEENKISSHQSGNKNC